MIRDYNLSGESSQYSLDNTEWRYQSFTPWSSYNLNKIDLKLWKSGEINSVTLLIKAVDSNNKPTGSILAISNISGLLISTSSPGTWISFELNTVVPVVFGSKFCFIIHHSSGGFLYYRVGINTSYDFGLTGYSYSPGDYDGPWTITAAQDVADIIFKTYDSLTYPLQTIFVAGTSYEGNNLWKILDDGTSLVLQEAYPLVDDVIDMVFNAVSKRLYIAIGSNIYCYNPYTMSLITSWAIEGILSIGNTIRKIAIDSYDYLAVTHDEVDTNKQVSLYDSLGSLLWRNSTFGIGAPNTFRIAFTVTGNICVSSQGGALNSTLVARLNRDDGTYITKYLRDYSGANSEALDTFHGSEGFEARLFYTYSVASSILFCKDAASQIWFKSISGVNINDLIHFKPYEDDEGLVIVSDGGTLRSYGDADGLAQSWQLYTPDVSGNLGLGTITKIYKDIRNNLILCSNGGFIAVGNPSLSIRTSLQVSSVDLSSIIVINSGFQISRFGGFPGLRTETVRIIS